MYAACREWSLRNYDYYHSRVILSAVAASRKRSSYGVEGPLTPEVACVARLHRIWHGQGIAGFFASGERFARMTRS